MIAYLLLVHEEPAQFARLLRRLLADPAARAFVHVDRTSEQRVFQAAADDFGARVRFVERRETIRWSGFEVCRATLHLMRAAADAGADYQVLLSGADYPIRPSAALHRTLESQSVFLDTWPMPDRERDKLMTRLTKFHISGKNRMALVPRVLNPLLRALPNRRIAAALGGARPYGGSQWWAMPRDIVTTVLHYVDSHPDFVRLFRWAQTPDEMFFHTIVAATVPAERIRRSLTFVDWSRPAPRPAVLDGGDLDLLVQAARDGYAFARKFRWPGDGSLYDELDRLLG